MKTKMIIKNQDGATLVEFALITPLLFLLIFGIIEFGLLLFNKHVITTSSREGARAGIVAREDRFTDGDVVDVEDTVNDWIANLLVTFGGTDQPDIAVEIRNENELDEHGEPKFCQFDEIEESARLKRYRDDLRVRVSYDYYFLFLSTIWPAPINIVAETTMKME